MAREWFLQSSAKELGPYSASEMKEHAIAGLISPDTPVRKGVSGKWLKASKVKGLLEPSGLIDERVPPNIDRTTLPTQKQPIAEQHALVAPKADNAFSFKHRNSIAVVGGFSLLILLSVVTVLLFANRKDHPENSPGDEDAAKGKMALGNDDATKAEMALEKGDWDIAIAYFNAAIKQRSNNPNWLARRGYATACKASAYRNSTEPAVTHKYITMAVDDCSEAVRLDASHDNLKTRAEVFLIANEENEEKEGIHLMSPPESGALLFKPIINHPTPLNSSAIADFSHALLLEPNDEDCYLRRAKLYRNEGDYKSAIMDCNKAVAIDKHSFDAFALRASVFHDCGGDDKALADIQEAMRISPDGNYQGILRKIESEPNNQELVKEIADAENQLKSTENRIASEIKSRGEIEAEIKTDMQAVPNNPNSDYFNSVLSKWDSMIKSSESERSQIKSEVELLKADLQKRKAALIEVMNEGSK